MIRLDVLRVFLGSYCTLFWRLFECSLILPLKNRLYLLNIPGPFVYTSQRNFRTTFPTIVQAVSLTYPGGLPDSSLTSPRHSQDLFRNANGKRRRTYGKVKSGNPREAAHAILLLFVFSMSSVTIPGLSSI